jgi:hypothetical protein
MSNIVVYTPITAIGTAVGTTVGAIVYTSLITTGEIAAATTEIGIDITGSVLGFGTDLIAGTMAGNTVRGLGRTYKALARPTILSTSRLSALGISAIAGTTAALATTLLIYGGQSLTSLIQSSIDNYKQVQAEAKVDDEIKAEVQAKAYESIKECRESYLDINDYDKYAEQIIKNIEVF